MSLIKDSVSGDLLVETKSKRWETEEMEVAKVREKKRLRKTEAACGEEHNHFISETGLH